MGKKTYKTYMSAASVIDLGLYTLPEKDANGLLTPRALAVADMSDCDAVIEWAARLCYRSNDKFATNPSFINGLMKAGHYDVAEHCVCEIGVEGFSILSLPHVMYFLSSNYPYMRFAENKNTTYFSANLRIWYSIFSNPDSLPQEISFLVDKNNYNMKVIFSYVAPNLFSEFFGARQSSFANFDLPIDASTLALYDHSLPIETETGAVVTMLSYAKSSIPAFSHATFQIDHVSRAFTHQHVRHRLLSHSQESMRYVDMSSVGHVIPKHLTEEQIAVVNEAVQSSMFYYKKLREMGVKKEDARAVLPNTTKTRIVSSAYMNGWHHYISLRDDKSAQLEIREVARAIKSHLQNAGLYDS